MKARIVDVTPQNIDEHGIFCIVNKKHIGYERKRLWFEGEYRRGLRLNIIYNEEGKRAGFIEYTRGEHFWRPVSSSNYVGIHCIWVYPRSNWGKGYASMLIERAIAYALQINCDGVFTVSGDPSWIANSAVFSTNGFTLEDHYLGYDLMVRKFNSNHDRSPRFLRNELDHNDRLSGSDWTFVYADQCPMAHKCGVELGKLAAEKNIAFSTVRHTDAKELHLSPSPFATMTLMKGPKIKSHYYVSKGRWKNMLRKDGVE